MPKRTAGEETGRYLLHFGAVDQRCGSHQRTCCGQPRGWLSSPYHRYMDAMNQTGENLLTVRVQDDSDTSYHARGKQKLQRGGIYYTAQSGIWQTVWMEKVPRRLHKKPPRFSRIWMGKGHAQSKDGGRSPADSADLSPLRPCLRQGRQPRNRRKSLGALGRQEPLVCPEGRPMRTSRISLDTVCPLTCETPFLYPLTVTLGIRWRSSGELFRSAHFYRGER